MSKRKLNANEKFESDPKRVLVHELDTKTTETTKTEQNVLIDGPTMLIHLYNPELDKRIYLFGDIHKDGRSCAKQGFPKPTYMTFMEFVESVLKTAPERIDLFVETHFPGAKDMQGAEYIRYENQSYGPLFNSVVPYLNKLGCFQHDKAQCLKAFNSKLHVHYADIRKSAPDWEDTYGFVVVFHGFVDETLRSLTSQSLTTHKNWLLEEISSYKRDLLSKELPAHKHWYAKSLFSEEQRLFLEHYMLQAGRHRHQYRLSIDDLKKNPTFTWEEPVVTFPQAWALYKGASIKVMDLVLAELKNRTDFQAFKQQLLFFITYFEKIHGIMFHYLLMQSMDVYDIERYLKPDIRNIISYLGLHHIERQAHALTTLFGFQEVFRIPNQHVRSAELYGGSPLLFPPEAVNAQIVELTEKSKSTELDDRIWMLCEFKNKSRKLIPGREFKFGYVDQCLIYPRVYSLQEPLFPIAKDRKILTKRTIYDYVLQKIPNIKARVFSSLTTTRQGIIGSVF